MSLNVITKKITLSDGREITIETGKLAKQADGSVVVRMGDTMLLATVVSAKEAKGFSGTNYFAESIRLALTESLDVARAFEDWKILVAKKESPESSGWLL